MKEIATTWIVTFIGVIAPMSLWNAFDIFILENCDPKFGCLGSYQLTFLILSACGFVSSFAVLSSCLLLKNITTYSDIFNSLKPAFISGCILSILSNYLFMVPTTEDYQLVVFWFIVSFVISVVVYFAQIKYNKANSHGQI